MPHDTRARTQQKIVRRNLLILEVIGYRFPAWWRGVTSGVRFGVAGELLLLGAVTAWGHNAPFSCFPRGYLQDLPPKEASRIQRLFGCGDVCGQDASRNSGNSPRPGPRARTLPSRRTLGEDTSSQPGGDLASRYKPPCQDFRNPHKLEGKFSQVSVFCPCSGCKSEQNGGTEAERFPFVFLRFVARLCTTCRQELRS